MSDVEKQSADEALEKEAGLQKKLPQASNNVRGFGRASKGAAGGVNTLGAAVKAALGPISAAVAAVRALAQRLIR